MGRTGTIWLETEDADPSAAHCVISRHQFVETARTMLLDDDSRDTMEDPDPVFRKDPAPRISSINEFALIIRDAAAACSS